MLTETYSRLHEAFLAVAREEGISPFAARVLFAISETRDGVRSDELEAMLAQGSKGGSMVRRSLLELYGAHAVGVPRRKGVRTRVTLTERGRLAALRVLELACDGGTAL